jgi:hypothetical protein
MDNTWRNIFREYVSCYEALQTLGSNDILVGEDYENANTKLLEEIIDTMRREIEE